MATETHCCHSHAAEDQGMPPVGRKLRILGGIFLFLVASVATDYTEIGLLWSNIGRRTALWLPAVTLPQILLSATVFNLYI